MCPGSRQSLECAYQPQRGSDEALVERIARLAQRHPRYGYRRIWALLRREGWMVNHKRIQRLWQQARLQVLFYSSHPSDLSRPCLDLRFRP